MAFSLGNLFNTKKSSPKKTKRESSACTKVAYKECRKKTNQDCEWVYGSINGKKTKVRKRHCRTRRNTKRT